jgi:hypothetical protein
VRGSSSYAARWGLLANASVAIDSSKFKNVNSRDNNFTQGKIDLYLPGGRSA